jgi:adenylate cyclase
MRGLNSRCTCPSQNKAGGEKMANLLIVEDRADVAGSYKEYLEAEGPDLNVIIAKDENEAKSILDKEPIDVIVTDLVMRDDQGGIEVLRAAKRKDPLIMVILVTAFDSKLDRDRAFELGAFDCLTKATPDVKTAKEILVKANTALHFRQLALGQLESQKKATFLRRYFDPRVFEAIDRNPELLNVQTRYVSVVFSDIRGFSRLCEILKAKPELVEGFLREYFGKASEVVFRHEGVLDKFMGDAVMALFGALDGNAETDHHANSAVRASLELRQRFGEVLEKWKHKWAPFSPQTIDIGLGCGIHSGEALVGVLGSDSRDQFTALGAHVNFAERIESRADPGQILISATTRAVTGDEFELKYVDTIRDVKNIAGEFDIWEVLGLRTRGSPYQVASPRTP